MLLPVITATTIILIGNIMNPHIFFKNIFWFQIVHGSKQGKIPMISGINGKFVLVIQLKGLNLMNILEVSKYEKIFKFMSTVNNGL